MALWLGPAAWAVYYVGARASIWEDGTAWLIDREITWRDFVLEGAGCPVCRLWWCLLLTHVMWWDPNLLRLFGTYGLFIFATDVIAFSQKDYGVICRVSMAPLVALVGLVAVVSFDFPDLLLGVGRVLMTVAAFWALSFVPNILDDEGVV